MDVQALIAGAAGGALSAIVTYFSTRAKLRLDLAAEYDKQLQEQRLAVYKQLWAMLEPLARYGREKPVTLATLRTLSSATRTWYFQVGGIYLTGATRAPYFRWKELMQSLLDRHADATAETTIPDDRLREVIAAASELRTHLSDDIGTKRLTRI